MLTKVINPNLYIERVLELIMIYYIQSHLISPDVYDTRESRRQ